MHEVSLCENMLEILKAHAEAESFTRVKRVSVAIGPLSCVEPEALRFGFDVVMKGSIADGAALEIEQTQAEALCLTCMETVLIGSRLDPCPACGGTELHMTGGDGLKIRELEVM
ncbi:hydrogenase maturation nickel metallochaperone HypA [Roseibium denhamense]|uniref:Hydrogenase maturation factor HypA n=1 Tax=Roseibium denhamense TaxID=76305 RepID=A0ABY1NHM1_9HYPH|nr:hydrogenase maturation nickel metallochaperone HypA [Roseibium denhamense]MTI06494.1 hydrogenase maturation nickel metallochaperone HypA [Roseibium denhamense]SMP09566.1 hydrogenase nickel incorporation protein HypA/HybF [Roseibium denhamense]